MGVWITVFIAVFIVGSIMGLKPSAREGRLDNLRMQARKIDLQPKLVACPDWIKGNQAQKGKGMIPQYGLVIDEASMTPCDYQIIDGQWRPYTGNYPANFALDKQPINLPDSIAPYAKGLSCKANFICLYWQENMAMGDPRHLETTQNDLITLKSQLQQLARLVQNG